MAKIIKNKPFYLTSEWWVLVGTEIAAGANLVPTGDVKIRTIVMGAAAVAYKISRGLAKSGPTS
jgi:hypothetical protein